jgi:hypothetical protein
MTLVRCGAEDLAGQTARSTFYVDVVAAADLAGRGSAAQGATWLVGGRGFAPGSVVTITLGDANLANPRATRGGTVAATIRIPTAAPLGLSYLVEKGHRADGALQMVVTPLVVRARGGTR